MSIRIGYFPIRDGVNLSACLFPIRIVSSGLGLPVGASQLCSPGSVVLSVLGGAARVAEALVRFPNNVACNSLITSSDFDIRPLELQCLWAVLKTGRGELRATFMWMRRACAAGAHAVVCA